MKRIKTKFPGVRYRESDTRRFKDRPERYYTIRYSIESRSVEEPAGWEIEGMTPQKASLFFVGGGALRMSPAGDQSSRRNTLETGFATF